MGQLDLAPFADVFDEDDDDDNDVDGDDNNGNGHILSTTVATYRRLYSTTQRKEQSHCRYPANLNAAI